eukprot:gene2601-4848_t
MVHLKSFRVGRRGDGSIAVTNRNAKQNVLLVDTAGNAAELSTHDAAAAMKAAAAGPTAGLTVDCHGVLGMVTLDGIKYMLLITDVKSLGTLVESAEILKVTHVSVIQASATGTSAAGRALVVGSNSPVEPLRKMLCDGSFYYAANGGSSSSDENPYSWNCAALEAFQQPAVTHARWFPSVMRGSIKIATMYADGVKGRCGVLFRLSSSAIGVGSAGINDAGDAACAAETEQVCCIRGNVLAHVQVRGSAPLFWEDTSSTVLSSSPRLKLTRGFEAAQHAFAKHVRQLEAKYGSCSLISLLQAGGGADSEQKLHAEYAITAATVVAQFHGFDWNKYAGIAAPPFPTLTMPPPASTTSTAAKGAGARSAPAAVETASAAAAAAPQQPAVTGNEMEEFAAKELADYGQRHIPPTNVY